MGLLNLTKKYSKSLKVRQNRIQADNSSKKEQTNLTLLQ
jgi:hypothetical protein